MAARLGLASLAVAIWLSTGSPASADGQWVFGGYVGTAHTVSGALSISQPALATNFSLASVDYEGRSFSAPLYYGYRVGYLLPRQSWLGIEAEFIHLKVYARTDRVSRVSGQYSGAPVNRDTPVRDMVENFSLSHGLNFAVVNVVARRVVARTGSDAAMALVARAGAGPTIPHAESRIGGVFREGYEIGAPAIHAAGGIEIGLLRDLFVMAEYKFTTTRQAVTVAEGRARGRFTTHHAVAGLQWRLQ